ncbi:MAG: mandelate racemase/muconate lactonizing enzyme family protein [Planctomycetota bacterium]|nr:mandelate racemase/muconate lactonizing enzyme family protein [Planctomycetota bacterium]
MKIKDIEIIWLDVPFHEVPHRNTERRLSRWHIIEICRVTTDNGLTGFGETLPHYTWGRVTDAAIERARGGNPFELVWDKSMGAGLQMALLDIMGKAAEVPVYQLLGTKHRDWCPISWWGIDMSPEDFALEAASAVEQGYMSFKQKARPWWDVYEQARLSSEVVPENFKLDLDFNAMLNNASTAVPILKKLDKYSKIAIYESPIPQDDVEGNRRIRQQARCAIAMHYGSPPIMTALREEVCDGFVIGGEVRSIMDQFHVVSTANLVGWLQMVGTAWTTTLALHLGAVCTHARWPAVTCMNMYVDQLVTEPIEVRGGYARVPEKPGLGIEFNEDSLKWRVDSIEKENVRAVYALKRSNGEKTWYHAEGESSYINDAMAGNQPVCEHGVCLERWDDDGSKDWKDLNERITEHGPVRSRE